MAVAVRATWLEEVRSPWTWGILPIALGFAFLLFSPRALVGDAGDRWNAILQGTKLVSLVLSLWAAAGILSREVSSGRADLLLAAGLEARSYARGLAVAWAVFLVCGTWLGGVVLVAFLSPVPVPPGSVLLALALAPVNPLVLYFEAVLLGTVLRGRTNILAALVAWSIPYGLDRVMAACGLAARPGEALNVLFSPASHIYSAAGPDGVIFYHGAWRGLLLAAALVAGCFWGTGLIFGRGSLRERLR